MPAESLPLISVITPSYNSARYIERAIQSVISQNYPNYEHIVMDGGSKDGTVEILKKYNHIIWKSEPDSGQSQAMNRGFAKAKGEIIVYLNADDFFDLNIFNIVAAAFKNPRIDMVVGNGTMVNDTGKFSEWKSQISYWKCLLHFKYGFPFNPVSYFYRRKVQQSIGFNEENTYTMDYEFLLEAFRKYKAVKVEENFGFFYFDGNNKTSRIDAVEECRKTALNFCKRKHILGLVYYVARYQCFLMIALAKKYYTNVKSLSVHKTF
jgi:glycosyltransferase involved in cell wall biosynthesis